MSKPLFLTQSASPEYEWMVELTKTRHQDYCSRWGYEYLHDKLPSAANVGWQKIQTIRRLLDDPDISHIFYVDADAAVYDLAVDMRTVFPYESAWLGLVLHPSASKWEMWHWQAGVMYFRNTDRAKAFLDTVLSLWYGNWEFLDAWGEQNAINYLLTRCPDWNEGVLALSRRWNVNHYNQEHGDSPVVFAWHGAHDRYALMRAEIGKWNGS